MINVPERDGFYFDDELKISIEKNVFNERFTNIDTYEGLIAHINCTPAWREVFDSWKQRGLLS